MPDPQRPITVTLQVVSIVLFTFIGYLNIGIPLAVLPGYVHSELGFGAVIAIVDAHQPDGSANLPAVTALASLGLAAVFTTSLAVAGPGFRDFTRIAASDPIMWRDVFLTNKDATLDVLGRFAEELFVLQRAIRVGDGAFLQEYFTRTRAIRRSIIEAGQDTAAPNFGRGTGDADPDA